MITYNAIFCASCSSEPWRQAVEPREMHSQGLQAELITGSASFSARDESELGRLALEPLEMDAQYL